MADSPEPTSPGGLLITGASGFLGESLIQLAQIRGRVQGVYHRHSMRPVTVNSETINAATADRVTYHRLDLTDAEAVTAWFRHWQPDGVIHTAALSQPNRCEQDPDLSYAINVQASETLATLCREAHIPLVFTSTDQVFDGQSAPYDETSLPNPINTYGRHKLEAEQRIWAIYPAAALCRLPLLYGPPGLHGTCFLQDFLGRLRAGQPQALFIDEYRSPAYVDDVAAGLLLALNHPGTLLHLGGPERISRYEFGLRMAEVFALNAQLLQPCRQTEVAMAAARPADVSSNSQQAMDLGYRPRGVLAGLESVRQRESP